MRLEPLMCLLPHFGQLLVRTFKTARTLDAAKGRKDRESGSARKQAKCSEDKTPRTAYPLDDEDWSPGSDSGDEPAPRPVALDELAEQPPQRGPHSRVPPGSSAAFADGITEV
eukprot:399165-Prymnesium_polylepis.1